MYSHPSRTESNYRSLFCLFLETSFPIINDTLVPRKTTGILKEVKSNEINKEKIGYTVKMSSNKILLRHFMSIKLINKYTY